MYFIAKPLIFAAALTSLSGCEFLRIQTFNEHTKSGDKTPYSVETAMFRVGPTTGGGAPVPGAGQFGPGLAEAARRSCSTAPAAKPRSLGPVAAAPALAEAAIGLVLDALFAGLERSITRFNERSQRVYKGRVLLDLTPAMKSGAPHCLSILRKAGKEGRLALLLRVEGKPGGKPDALVIKPVYAEIRHALAITGQDGGIDLAVAISGKAALRSKEGPVVKTFAADAFSLNGLKIGVPKDDFSEDAGTGLFAFYPNGTSTVELTIALTESGTGLPDAERAQAELKAIREAAETDLKSALGLGE